MFPATFRWGNRARVWNTMPMSRVCGDSSVMSSPSRNTRPSVGGSSPAISRSSVVFPQPEGPRNEISFAGGRWRSMPATAWTSPNRLTSPWSRRAPRPSPSWLIRGTLGGLGDDHLRPLLVDPVLQLVVDPVLGTEGGLGTRAAHGLVLLGREVHGLLHCHRRCPQRPGQLGLDRRLAHVVDERVARLHVLAVRRDVPE